MCVKHLKKSIIEKFSKSNAFERNKKNHAEKEHFWYKI